MRRALAPAVLAAAVALTACATANGPSPAALPDDGVAGDLLVLGAASLTDAFAQVADAFAATHPAVTVSFGFAGSQTLASQILQGAPGDVFASADDAQMSVVAEAGRLDGTPAVFARNRLAIAVEPGNPLAIGGLDDLARADLVVVLPAPEVPAGRYARAALDAAGAAPAPASLARDVRAALSAVALGEADAALVYASDIAAAGGRVDGVDIPAEGNVEARYPIAALAGSAHPEAARAFVDFVLSAQGQRILVDHGFAAP